MSLAYLEPTRHEEASGDDAVRRAADAGRAAGDVLKDRFALERQTVQTLVGYLTDLKKALSHRLLTGAGSLTDFKRFALQALLADADRLIADAQRRIAMLAERSIQGAADLGDQYAEEPLDAAKLPVSKALPGLDQAVIQATFGNTVKLLTPPMQQFADDTKRAIRGVALAGDNKFEAIQKLRDRIAGQGMDAAQYKAERIIRTELGRTFNAATYERLVALSAQFPFLKKGWRATKDGRTRMGHREAGAKYVRGQGVDIRGAFVLNVYDERPGKAPKPMGKVALRYPVDPLAVPAGKLAAAATIMCRCNAFVDFDLAEFRQHSRTQISLALGTPVVPPPVKPPAKKPTPVAAPAPAPPQAGLPQVDLDDPKAVRAKLDAIRQGPTYQLWEAQKGKLDALQKTHELARATYSQQYHAVYKQVFDDLPQYRARGDQRSHGEIVTSHPMIAALNRELNDLKAKMDRLKKEIDDLFQATRSLALQAIELPQNRRTRPTLTHGKNVVGTQHQTAMDFGADEFSRFVSRPSMTTNSLRTHWKGGRSNCGHGTMNMGTDAPSIVIHEMIHNLEDVDPWVAEQSKAFLIRRTQGDVARPLKTLTGGGYGREERATRDGFGDQGSWGNQNVYAGKWYRFRLPKAYGGGAVVLPNWDAAKKYLYATEVLTMGVQRMYEDPLQFAQLDPDWFDFAFSVPRGREYETAFKTWQPWDWNHIDGVAKVPNPNPPAKKPTPRRKKP